MKILRPKNITVVILAGGKGRRMGGQDKGLVNFNNLSLIKHVIDGISLQTDKIIISANRNLKEYASFGYPVVSDKLNDFQGPLAGFLACMSAVKTDFILTLPCDGPVIREDYLQKMMDGLNSSSSTELAIASDGSRMQPVYALIPLKLKQSLSNYLNEGGRKIDLWYQQHKYTLVKFETESQFFTNINSIQDLDNFSQ